MKLITWLRGNEGPADVASIFYGKDNSWKNAMKGEQVGATIDKGIKFYKHVESP